MMDVILPELGCFMCGRKEHTLDEEASHEACYKLLTCDRAFAGGSSRVVCGSSLSPPRPPRSQRETSDDASAFFAARDWGSDCCWSLCLVGDHSWSSSSHLSLTSMTSSLCAVARAEYFVRMCGAGGRGSFSLSKHEQERASTEKLAAWEEK